MFTWLPGHGPGCHQRAHGVYSSNSVCSMARKVPVPFPNSSSRILKLASFENSQLALEFSGKDIKIRPENITEYRIKKQMISFFMRPAVA